MKIATKFLAIVLVLCMLTAAFAACGKGGSKGGDDTEVNIDESKLAVSSREVVTASYGATETSEAVTVTMNLDLVDDTAFADYPDWELYKDVLGDYYKYLLAAKAQADVSAKYAVMAIAEAKLLESGAFLPLTTEGGNYAISRVAPNTGNNALWGLDSDRYENIIVATNFITAADRDVMRAKYLELKGTGKYQSWVLEYLQAKGYTTKDSYSIGYSSEPKTWDILKTYRAADSRAIINTIDGLLSYDCEGRLCFALAKSVTISEDGLTYTFTLRDGLKWVTQDGEEYAPVKAQDFVDGMQHMLDTNAGLNGLVRGVIKNASEYLDGKAEFSEVGVKATDDKTLVYTLDAPLTYFLTMLEYNTFMPMCKAYADAQGKDYGKDEAHILYCGPYLVENHTKDNKIVFKANPSYWNKDNVRIKTLSWNYNDGKDVTKSYNDAKAGTIDGAGLNTTTIPLAAKDKLFETYAYVSGTSATTFSGFVNIKRTAFETDGYESMTSTQTAEQKAATAVAIKNADFRNALLKAIDQAAYNAAKDGEATKLNSIRNTYTPGNFVKLLRPVTIQIGTETKTFPKGTYYGEIMQAQLTADGSSVTVWNPTGGDGDGSSDGFDGWYNPTAAKAHLEAAIAALPSLNISADNPIVIDFPVFKANAQYAAAGQVVKQSVETALDGKVVVNLVDTTDIYGWYYAGYYCDFGAECNYDLYDCSGWGPDYGDPATYLNTFIANGGDMMHVLGID